MWAGGTGVAHDQLLQSFTSGGLILMLLNKKSVHSDRPIPQNAIITFRLSGIGEYGLGISAPIAACSKDFYHLQNNY
jgi:hypothetical protein